MASDNSLALQGWRIDGVVVTACPFPTPTPTPSPTPPLPLVTISQVYGGGGNTSAPLLNDFVEIFNRGSTNVDLTGWSVQYASAAGVTWAVTPLCPTGPCTLVPGRYFLVKEASGGAVGAALPPPDVTGTINLAGTAGKVALLSNTTQLTGSGCRPNPASLISLATERRPIVLKAPALLLRLATPQLIFARAAAASTRTITPLIFPPAHRLRATSVHQ